MAGELGGKRWRVRRANGVCTKFGCGLIIRILLGFVAYLRNQSERAWLLRVSVSTAIPFTLIMIIGAVRRTGIPIYKSASAARLISVKVRHPYGQVGLY